jgi:hypothetical protein
MLITAADRTKYAGRPPINFFFIPIPSPTRRSRRVAVTFSVRPKTLKNTQT